MWSNDILLLLLQLQATSAAATTTTSVSSSSKSLHYIDHVIMKHLPTHVCSTTIHFTSTVLYIVIK